MLYEVITRRRRDPGTPVPRQAVRDALVGVHSPRLRGGGGVVAAGGGGARRARADRPGDDA